MLTTWTPAPHSKKQNKQTQKVLQGGALSFLGGLTQTATSSSSSSASRQLHLCLSLPCKELLMLCGLHIARGGKMVHLPSLSFPATVALPSLHVVRWGGSRMRDRRARPLCGVRGSCCKVLNQAVSPTPAPPTPLPLCPAHRQWWAWITSRLKAN